MYNLMKNRRSIRKYKAEKVDKGLIDLLLKSILRSPSGKSINPWEFVYIDETDMLVKLSQSKKFGAKFLKNAPQCIVVLADETKTDIWIEDASIAATIAHLTAESLGLGSCWIQIRNRGAEGEQPAEEYVQKALGIPANMRVEAIISVGYPDEEKKPHGEESLEFGKVHMNTYGSKYFK